MTAKVFKPPRSEYLLNNDPVVFLAGSIDNGKSGNWAQTLTDSISDLKINILNPRRDDWNPDVDQSIDDPMFNEQVHWELRGMEVAKTIAMYFEPESISPITLLEFGLWVRSGKLIVACPPGFWRRGNLEVTGDRYDVPIMNSLEELSAEIRRRHS